MTAPGLAELAREGGLEARSAFFAIRQETEMEREVNRVGQELAFQAERARRLANLTATPDHIIERYRRLRFSWAFPKDFAFKKLGNLAGRSILDFGCGEGEITTQLARLGARVTGVDISPELVALAEQRARLDGVEDRVELAAIDVTQSPLPPDRFDAVLCYAVLHHVDIHAVVPVVLRSLKPEGTAVFVEPIALSQRFQKVRDALPIGKRVSAEEKQLVQQDLDYIRGLLESPEICFFNFLGRLQRFFPDPPRTLASRCLKRACLVAVAAADRMLIALCPPLRRYFGEVVIVGRKAGSRPNQVARGVATAPSVGPDRDSQGGVQSRTP